MGLEIEMACNGCERRIQLDDALYCPECQEKALLGQNELTDIEMFLSLYRKWGFVLEVKKGKVEGNQLVRIAAGQGSKIRGFPKNHTDIIFSKEGKFISQGIWY